MTECLDQYIASISGAEPRRHTLCDTPPLDAHPGAALNTAAVRILDGSDLRVLGDLLAPARYGASRKTREAGDPPLPARRSRLLRRIPGRARAPDQQLPARRPALTRTPGTRPQLTFAPEHIPEHLQDDWYDQHLRHIGGNTRLLRRAALRLVQMSAGGSLTEATAFLGIDHRYLKASPGSAAFTDDQAEFRLAVHAIARHLSTTPGLINYKHRRGALQDWCIDTPTWQDIISPPTKGPFQPERSDCKRQFASEAVWARITQGEHLLPPRIIEKQAASGDPTWHRRRDNMWHFYDATPAKPHYAALRRILSPTPTISLARSTAMPARVAR